MPYTRSLALGGGTVALLALQGLAVAQSSGPAFEPGLGTRVATGFVISLVVYLLLGGALAAFAPRYADETVREIEDDPGGAFLWGLIAGIAVPIALLVLAVTIIGLVVAIPGFVLLVLVGIVGNAVTVAWVGTALSDGELDGTAVGIGALVLAVLAAIPVVGNLLTTVVGFFGLGVVSRRLYESRQSGASPPRRDPGTERDGDEGGRRLEDV